MNDSSGQCRKAVKGRRCSVSQSAKSRALPLSLWRNATWVHSAADPEATEAFVGPAGHRAGFGARRDGHGGNLNLGLPRRGRVAAPEGDLAHHGAPLSPPSNAHRRDCHDDAQREGAGCESERRPRERDEHRSGRRLRGIRLRRSVAASSRPAAVAGAVGGRGAVAVCATAGHAHRGRARAASPARRAGRADVRRRAQAVNALAGGAHRQCAARSAPVPAVAGTGVRA